MVRGNADRRFRPLVQRFASMFRRPSHGGGALCVYLDGEPVVDVWTGYADSAGAHPWERETAAMSFSTTKGVVSTVVHRLVDRGLLDYDEPLASYWPAFGTVGKEHLSLRMLLSHQTGLHRIRGLVPSAEDLLDHIPLTELLASQTPHKPRSGGTGYHALTFGWLVAGLVHEVTGMGLRDAVARELADPLGLDGFWIGAPVEERHRVAELFDSTPASLPMDKLAARIEGNRRTRYFAEALLIDGFERLLYDPERRILDTEMPAANGVFTARSLARMYSALATDGSVDGVQVLTPGTLREAGRVQHRGRDYVLGLPMRWRLGYHQAFTAGRPAWKAFGHFGYGGSGAWADPETRMSVAFVTNRLGSVTTPVGDVRLPRLGSAALGVVRGLDRTANTANAANTASTPPATGVTGGAGPG
jgi:CubicO group peptidase (beta-lactamase class C family)